MRIVSVSVLILFSVVPSSSSQASQSPFSLTISALTAEVKAGSDVHLKIQMTNTSNHDLDCTGSPSNGLDRAYQYEVRDSTGKLVPRVVQEHPDIGGTFSTWPCTINPGETADAAGGVVSHLYDMTKPGKYTIQVLRATDSPKGGIVKSNKITVTVTP